ncbi:MAG TPA: LOG family protein [Candidatus Polarisedimenticolaceae bacterium]|nr:LOG family protein [Candidatus Polarisedimenticolaceae bacterium]
MEKAYKNEEFLMSRDARALRILSEYIEPQSRFARYHVQDTVVFFGSARALPMEQAEKALAEAKAQGDAGIVERAESVVRLARYYEDARALARMMTEWSKSQSKSSRRFLVCSGGGPGIMEAANRGASEAHGISIGLGISLPFEASTNDYITREMQFEFHYFFMRKFWFVYLAKALVVFPGGFGTMDELFELLTLVQTQKSSKHMPIILYGREFWSDVLKLDALIKWGTISAGDLALFHIADKPEEAFEYLKHELHTLYGAKDSEVPSV